MNRNAEILTEKIQTLSPEQMGEVVDFIETLRLHAEERGHVRTAATMSVPTFDAVWNNPADDAYDAL